jgi:Flp pilus assembly pilin Flp
MGEGFFIMMKFIQQFVRDEDGQDVVEYALVLGLVALGGGVGLTAMAGGIDLLTAAVTTAIADATALV